MAKGVQKDETGKVYGLLTVIRPNHADDRSRKQKAVFWFCVCSCAPDNEISISGQCLRSGQTRSCGCLVRHQVQKMSFNNRTHGMTKSAEYRTWAGMNARCNDTKAKQYKDYGARGITVCEEWKTSFEAFYADMGPKPGKGFTIDRKDNNKGYNKSNCQWVTMAVQSKNKRNTKRPDLPKFIIQTKSGKFKVLVQSKVITNFDDAVLLRDQVLDLLGRVDG